MPKTIDPEDIETLRRIAAGTTHFRPVQDEPSDSPTWVRQVERLCRLGREGLIQMPEPKKHDDQAGYPAGVGPCVLTDHGRKVLDEPKG